MTTTRMTICCPECGHIAILHRRERLDRLCSRYHFSCTGLLCGAKFISMLQFSHFTRAGRSAAQCVSLTKCKSSARVPAGSAQ